MRKIVLSIAAMVLAGCASKDKASDTEGAEMTQVEFPGFDTDAHLYLEEVEGEQALDWVRTENERSLTDQGRGESNRSATVPVALQQDGPTDTVALPY